MSSFETQCPHCQATVEVPEELVDHKARCSDCNCKFIVHQDHSHEIIELPQEKIPPFPTNADGSQVCKTEDLDNVFYVRSNEEEYRDYRCRPKRTKQIFFAIGFGLLFFSILLVYLFLKFTE